VHQVGKAGQLLVSRKRVLRQPGGGAGGGGGAPAQRGVALSRARSAQQAVGHGKAHELGAVEAWRQLRGGFRRRRRRSNVPPGRPCLRAAACAAVLLMLLLLGPCISCCSRGLPLYE
jgi:hypothetical protein